MENEVMGNEVPKEELLKSVHSFAGAVLHYISYTTRKVQGALALSDAVLTLLSDKTEAITDIVHGCFSYVERSSIRVHELKAMLHQTEQEINHHTEVSRERQTERESFRVSLESGKARTGNLQKERERVYKRKQEALANLDEAEKTGVDIQNTLRNSRRARMLEMLRFTQCGSEIARTYVRELDGKLVRFTASNKIQAEEVHKAREKVKATAAAKQLELATPFPDMPEVDKPACATVITMEKELHRAANERFQKTKKLLEEIYFQVDRSRPVARQ